MGGPPLVPCAGVNDTVCDPALEAFARLPQWTRVPVRAATDDAYGNTVAAVAVTWVLLCLARAAISKARFHDGGESWLTEALGQVRKVLHREPGHPAALVLGALSLVLLDRAEPAERYLDEAKNTAQEDPILHLTLGELALQRGDEVFAEAMDILEASLHAAKA